MTLRILPTQAIIIAIATAAFPLFPMAVAQIAVSSNDGKVVLVNGVTSCSREPRRRHCHHHKPGCFTPKDNRRTQGAFERRRTAAKRRRCARQSFALVASHMKLDPADPKKQVPDNRVSVIDLKANPPAVIATLEAGLGATGTAINPAGTLALVANRNEGTVSIFTISGNKLSAAGKIDFGDPKSGPSGVAFTPDGKTVLVTRDGDHRISVLSVDASTVTDTKRIMTGGFRPYAVQVSPKGDIAVIGNQGANAGDIMPVNVVDLKGKAPRIVTPWT